MEGALNDEVTGTSTNSGRVEGDAGVAVVGREGRVETTDWKAVDFALAFAVAAARASSSIDLI